jgi:hypothetical protein
VIVRLQPSDYEQAARYLEGPVDLLKKQGQCHTGACKHLLREAIRLKMYANDMSQPAGRANPSRTSIRH